jgi:hypothetical protein
VTPMITRRDPSKKTLGTTTRKSMEDMEPMKPNARRNFFR